MGHERRYHCERNLCVWRRGVGGIGGVEAVDFGVEDEDWRAGGGEGVGVVAVAREVDDGGAGGEGAVGVGAVQGVLVEAVWGWFVRLGRVGWDGCTGEGREVGTWDVGSVVCGGGWWWWRV